ncbi:MAG: transglutaminase family protein [Hyphomicrobiales bacterium]|nr:MAG: transglutaminase family protein [Hyphomicrobiales bacterium]
MTILRVRHITTYAYKRPVGFGEHRVLFRPRDSYDQFLLDARIDVSPTPSKLRWIHDVFGNCVAIANFETRADELRFETNIVLDHTPDAGPRFSTRRRAQSWPFEYDPEDLPDLEPVMRRHYPDEGDEVASWAKKFVSPSGTTDTGHLLATMTMAIHESFNYSRRTNPGTQPPQVTMITRTGTCRDFALLMMEACRSLGLAARFVTGYIYVPSRDGSLNRGGGATHAWCQVFVPGAGWIEFDPTNGIVGNRDLIRVGVARDPRQAIPLSGTYAGKMDDPQGMTVQVNVTSADTAPDHVEKA